MAKHKFQRAVADEAGNVVGAQCLRCGQIVLLENGNIPEDISAQDCKGEDFSQAAARIVKQATEEKP